MKRKAAVVGGCREKFRVSRIKRYAEGRSGETTVIRLHLASCTSCTNEWLKWRVRFRMREAAKSAALRR